MNELEKLLIQSKPEDVSSPLHRQGLAETLREQMTEPEPAPELLQPQTYALLLTASLLLFALSYATAPKPSLSPRDYDYRELGLTIEPGQQHIKLPENMTQAAPRRNAAPLTKEMIEEYLKDRAEALALMH